MIIRIFFFLFGFGLCVIGLMYTILYLNLMSMGYNFLNYVNFIKGRSECYLTIFGIIIMLVSIYLKGDKKYELYL